MVKCKTDFASRATNQIQIQVFTESSDGYGGFTKSWATESTVWAIIEPKSGKETIKGEQRESNVNAQITIRYQAALSNTLSGAKRRVKFGTRYYNILSVQNVSSLEYKLEGSVFQILNCQEVKEGDA